MYPSRASSGRWAKNDARLVPSTPYGVRCIRIGNGVVISVGLRITAWSLTPSRIEIIASLRS